jgi:pimeloyl-ACP methyl ester carboxylesterase
LEAESGTAVDGALAVKQTSRFGRIWGRIHYVWVRAGVVALIGMPFVAFLTFRAQGLPQDTWQQTRAISIERADEFIQFNAVEQTSDDRLVIFPGCPVESSAYAPLARGLAGRGLTTIIMNIPFRCAPSASSVQTLRTRVTALLDGCAACTWTAIGHSRGAVHALDLVAALPGRFAGVVILGSTHPRERDFSRLSIPVMKVLATNDGVAPRSASEANRRLLPGSVRWEVIDGGNHSQFAYYGFQLFDGRATITRTQQHDRVTDLIAEFATQTP